jgi:hypothetical protein
MKSGKVCENIKETLGVGGEEAQASSQILIFSRHIDLSRNLLLLDLRKMLLQETFLKVH